MVVPLEVELVVVLLVVDFEVDWVAGSLEVD